MNKGEIIERVKMFADQAHGEQMRKYANERYIVHPIRVMEIVREYSQGTAVLAASLLHDVLEDTKVTEGQMHSFLLTIMKESAADETVRLVKELTDIYIKGSFPKMNRRARRTKEAERLAGVSAEAQTIKYADIMDNVRDISQDETDFALVYIRESKQLLMHMNAGNPELHKAAITTVDRALQAYFEKANIKAL
jgi:guanosine-3',5'-bis(diphosphate) 3'-pyrophosphohydrolase